MARYIAIPSVVDLADRIKRIVGLRWTPIVGQTLGLFKV